MVNTFTMAHLALLCRKRGIKLVHVSTDYVFSGTKMIPYVESDTPKPLQVYGRSKLAGEYAVLGADPANLVIRTASLFGVCGTSAKGGDFPSRIMAAAERDGEVKLRMDLEMSPTYIPDLAAGMVSAIHRHMNGVVHLAGVEPATWYDVAHEFITAAGIKAKVKRAFSVDDPIPRPKYSVLASERVVALPAWSDRIGAYLRLWNANPS
jgi:dTDP-4-dehydrorhamnose reductase